PQSRNGFEAELANAIPFAGIDALQPFDARVRIAPALGFPTQDDLVEDSPAQTLRFLPPLRGSLRRWHGRHTRSSVDLDLHSRQVSIENGLGEDGLEIRRRRKGCSGHQQPKKQ